MMDDPTDDDAWRDNYSSQEQRRKCRSRKRSSRIDASLPTRPRPAGTDANAIALKNPRFAPPREDNDRAEPPAPPVPPSTTQGNTVRVD